MLTTRAATINDIAGLTVLMNDLGYPTTAAEMQLRFEKITAHPDYHAILAVSDNEIVGMAGLYKGLYYEKNGMYMRIVAFVVKQNSRQLGIGRLLMEKAEQWARDNKLHTVLISSAKRKEREAAYAFYLKMGYAIKSSGFIKQL